MLSEIHGYGINQKGIFCKKSYQNLGAKFTTVQSGELPKEKISCNFVDALLTGVSGGVMCLFQA